MRRRIRTPKQSCGRREDTCKKNVGIRIIYNTNPVSQSYNNEKKPTALIFMAYVTPTIQYI